MLRANGGNDTVLRLYDIAYLLYLADILRAHLTQEYFVRGVKLTSYHLYNTHCCIVAFGSHQHIVFCSEQFFKIELCAGLAVATRKSHYGQHGKLVYYPLGVIDIMTVYHIFYRLIDNIGYHCNKQRQYLHRHYKRK